ncbi:histidinol-phosphatase [Salinadaptatus halalkaliphilus]|uniref:histidinol-phosphatase n=1 Tax=Salinadaptatus halalkaliphilus TaxID=2419781 RepID=A0A4S3TFY2_9EURY|nr:PHP domain-containing protein [Salinadaptatus halalkaliphilus]THE62819.1 histidinol-phosphatase [Salinadaptatus halalkaliphilus]
MQDFHVHSNYSDGSFLQRMVNAAERAGLEGVGFADHCAVSSRDGIRKMRRAYGFNLDLTYERRRQAIDGVREKSSIEVYDAVEMDYDPRDETEIRDFLESAEFDYAIGSVHGVDGKNVQVPANFTALTDDERDRVVDAYVDQLVSLIESELFDVAAHVDLLTRTPPLRGRFDETQYRRVARAFAESRTIPEINAGRAVTDEEILHPAEPFLEVLVEHDVAFTLGTDSHAPTEIGPRADFLADVIDTNDIDPTVPPSLETMTRH